MDSVVLRVLNQIVELLAEVGQGFFSRVSIRDVPDGPRFPFSVCVRGQKFDWEYRFLHVTTVYSY
jgi:hypothetical protein